MRTNFNCYMHVFSRIKNDEKVKFQITQPLKFMVRKTFLNSIQVFYITKSASSDPKKKNKHNCEATKNNYNYGVLIPKNVNKSRNERTSAKQLGTFHK